MSEVAMDFTLCQGLSEADGWQYMIFVPLGWSILIIIYFASIYFAVLASLVRGLKKSLDPNSKLGVAYEPVLDKGYLSETSVWKEIEQLRANEVFEEISTVSAYSTVTARGSQSLALFTAGVSITMLGIVVTRAIYVHPENSWDTFALCLTVFGNLMLICTGIWAFLPPGLGCDNLPIRNYNMIFSTSISTVKKLDRTIILAFHDGGVGTWALTNIVATLIRAWRADAPDRDISVSSFWLWVMFVLEIVLAAGFIIFFRKWTNRIRPKCQNCCEPVSKGGKGFDTFMSFFVHTPPRKKARNGIIEIVNETVSLINQKDKHGKIDSSLVATGAYMSLCDHPDHEQLCPRKNDQTVRWTEEGGFSCRCCGADYCFACGADVLRFQPGTGKTGVVTKADCMPDKSQIYCFACEVFVVITIALSGVAIETITLDSCGDLGLFSFWGYVVLFIYIFIAVKVIGLSIYYSTVTGTATKSGFDSCQSGLGKYVSKFLNYIKSDDNHSHPTENLELLTFRLFRYLPEFYEHGVASAAAKDKNTTGTSSKKRSTTPSKGKRGAKKDDEPSSPLLLQDAEGHELVSPLDHHVEFDYEDHVQRLRRLQDSIGKVIEMTEKDRQKEKNKRK